LKINFSNKLTHQFKLIIEHLINILYKVSNQLFFNHIQIVISIIVNPIF